MKALREQRRVQTEWRLKAGELWEDSGLVFTDELGRHLSHVTVRKHFKKAVESIGIPEARFHDLRHSFAVNSLQGGRQPEDRAGKPRSRDGGIHAGRLRPCKGAHETGFCEPHGSPVSEHKNDRFQPVRGKLRGKRRFWAKKKPRKR